MKKRAGTAQLHLYLRIHLLLPCYEEDDEHHCGFTIEPYNCALWMIRI